LEQDIPESFEEEFTANWQAAFDFMAQRLLLLPDLKYRITLDASSKASASVPLRGSWPVAVASASCAT
jgi:hypothetical protein